jgi:ribokinase
MSAEAPGRLQGETPQQDARAIVIVGSYLVALVMDVERIPIPGETVLARNFREAYGGKGSDMAVQAARLGAPVHFVGCIGDDDFGRAFARLMEEEGVNTDHLHARGELATGAGFIIKDKGGRNVITIDIGANQLFAPADVDAAADRMAPGSVVLTQLEIPLETALHAMQVGRARGATTILNTAPAHDLRSHHLSAVDYLTPNETEARVCLGLAPDDPTPDDEIARRLLALGCSCVVMTLGARGCLIADAAGAQAVEAFPLGNVVDSNGAGDSFNAAFATALTEGMPRECAARFANAVAGLCCTRWDTVPSYHSRSEVDEFLAQAGGL